MQKKKQKKVYYEFRTRHKNGNYINVSATGKSINTEGKDTIIAVIRDITERKIAEEKLKASEEKYKTIINNLMDIVIILDLNGNIHYISPQIYDVSGFKPEELIGTNCCNLMYPDDIKKAIEVIKEGRDTKKKMNIEYKAMHKDGYYLNISAIGRIVNIDGEDRIFEVARDITNQKRAEQKLIESEEKFRNLFNNSPNIIVLLDQKGNILDVNRSFLSYYSIQKNELIGRNFQDFTRFDAKNTSIFTEKYKEVIKNGNIKPFELEILNEKGESLWMYSQASTIKIGNQSFIQVILQDITERKEAEQKLKASEQMFRTITEQAFVGVLIIQNEKIEYVNNALLQIFEYSYEDVYNWLKDDLLGITHPEDLQNLKEYRKKLKTDDYNMKQYYSYRVFTKSGKLKWIDQFSKPIIYKGKPAELISIMDITEKKKAEQELINLNNLKSEFLRRTSHELKTPLVSIKGYSDLLLNVHKERLDDYVLASIVEIKQGCERLESLIQDILNTAELETGTIQLKKKEEDLSFLIKLSIRELQGLIDLRRHKIDLRIHDKLVTSFEPEQIHRVISNLISNAIKYTPPNGTIEIKSEIKDRMIIISVKDTGIGITREEKERLFTQFGKIERYGQGLEVISDGSGLGLYISQKVIELHDGKIWVESEGRNKGSKFCFSLPLIMRNSD